MRYGRFSIWVATSIAFIAVCLCWVTVAVAEDRDREAIPLNAYGIRSLNPYVVERFTVDGRQIEKVIVPGPPTPPVGIERPVILMPQADVRTGSNTIALVPALTWSFGCSATSAAMMFGHYDNTAFPNMYTGPTSGGVFPMSNTTWGTAVINGETRALCPLSATRLGLDGRPNRGHVDDYWIAYGNTDQDPYISNGWPEHIWEDSTGDFMGTNQSRFGNMDGGTTFYYYSSGDPLLDYQGGEPSYRDGCHGMKLFAQSRGYTVTTNFTQLILGEGRDPEGNITSKGFTFADYKTEIDAGRPVMIQVYGHSMLGVGYDDTNSTIYIHDTWDHNTHSMIWGGEYANMQHYMVTVLRLATPAVSQGCPQCPDDGQISNVSYPVGVECTCSNTGSISIGEGVEIPDGAIVNFSADVSITTGSNLSIPSGATVTFTAPSVTVNPGFQAATGANVTIRQPP